VINFFNSLNPLARQLILSLLGGKRLGFHKSYQSGSRITLEVNLNVDKRSKSGKMIVQMGDRVDARGDVPDCQLGGERALGSEPSAPTASPAPQPTKHWSAPARQPVVVKALLWGIRIEFGGQLVKRTLPV